ncbi:MAG TPA: succinate dehydrogenase cytochrome b subunit [Dysgonamonadaceae bacterium]|nr:succinate dehydrogenase cytochrome b subunit [Dysgonamonadaceae bacterium]HOM63171.1 succinate dehydrogenase cytochrome b subunit [Dysgonamonadaceae bacterium]HOV36901.1 succinate dehydrogenase cytochrome b subunit [Dysgonamonadaceae bacterium]HRU13057.1 succinate dehydrogenase cytochrome b subunit [Dysgonamonadaceae bacterium]
MSWLIKSSIGRKFVQSISGLFLVLFLLFHMSMNLVLIFSYDAYNFIANEILGANWWAIIGTGVIALGFVVHIIYAIILTLQNRKARGSDKYASASKTPVAWSSKNMFVLGVFIVLFLLIHLYQLWYNMQFKELLQLPGAREDSAELVTEVLSNGWIFAIYIIAFVALWLHLTHGFWSALQTVGWNNTKWMKRIKVIGNIFATIICLGFMIVAIAVHFGFSNLLG